MYPETPTNHRISTFGKVCNVMAKLLVNLSSGKDNIDKATVAFVVANAGIAGGQETAVFLTVEAVLLAQQGFADDIHAAGFKPLKELLDSFVAGGGMIWV